MTSTDSLGEAPTGQGYARTLRIISVLGSVSIISVFLGVLKMKVAALILGPVGIGIIALLQNAVGVAATLGDAGMRQSGAREISRELATKELERVRRVLVTLSWMGIGFACLSSGLFFILRDVIAERLLGRPDLADEIGWSTAAVATTVVAAALTAMLNGHHRVREIGWITINSALLSCLISVAAIWWWGRDAIALFVVSGPLLLMLVSLWYVARAGLLPRLTLPSGLHLALAGKLLKLGVFVMLSAIVLSLSELAVRLAIQRGAGMVELGLFSAAWAIGVYYLNFLMVATSTEFFPRLSASFDDADERNGAINLQIQALCIVAAPVVIILSAFCPWILRIMYSAQFLPATDFVRLMVIGDVLRLSVYPMGFVLIAASRGRSFFALKLAEATLFAGFAAVLLPPLGLKGVGFAHIATFAVIFISYCATLRGGLGFRLSLPSAGAIAALLAMPLCLAILANMTEMGAELLGVGFLLLWAAFALKAWMKHRRPLGA
jgi:O-antigen/teichoic acid export membrane protein